MEFNYIVEAFDKPLNSYFISIVDYFRIDKNFK